MKRWLVLSRYHWTVLFAAMGLCAVVVAWQSFGLINLAMANYGYLSRQGIMGLVDGGLVQLIEIGLRGLVAMLGYFVFKGIESELVHRWQALR